jgi:hypothetical protein
VRDELQREEDMYGGGPAATLKSLKVRFREWHG